MSPTLTRRAVLSVPLIAKTLAASQAAPESRWRAEELRRYKTPEATQAVAVDATHFYAIGSYTLAKYEKKSGSKVAEWRCERGKPLIHLNSGVVRNGVLYCAHSNYPGVPMLSSIEMWDTKTLKHTGSHSLGISSGSLTWLDVRKGSWYINFAHYGNQAAEPNRDPKWTVLEQVNADWQKRQGWIYPNEVVAKLGQFSFSGGVFVNDDTLFCTGHDDPIVFVFKFPEGGSTMELQGSFEVPMHGQGIAWDASTKPGTLWGIERPTRETIVLRVQS